MAKNVSLMYKTDKFRGVACRVCVGEGEISFDIRFHSKVDQTDSVANTEQIFSPGILLYIHDLIEN